MSAIRPPAPSPLFPAQAPPPPVRASRSDFFRAALDGAAGPDAAPADPPRTPGPRRPQRPGALLDIRV